MMRPDTRLQPTTGAVMCRHGQLTQEWAMLPKAYDPRQFHVIQNGLALLAAYMLHMIDIRHATVPA